MEISSDCLPASVRVLSGAPRSVAFVSILVSGYRRPQRRARRLRPSLRGGLNPAG